VHAAERPPVQRYHPPGSEWLFVKLYCPRSHEEDLIGHSLLTFCDNVVAAGLADSWFFIRYSDPDAHLRLRFHGDPERLTSRLFGHLCQWANGLVGSGVCARFTFEPYEQEVERFGGIAGMAAAEAVFAADSRAAARLLRLTQGHAWAHDRTMLLALTIDDLLAGLGFDERQRLRWYRAQTNAKDAAVSSEYRQRKNVLRSLLGNPAGYLGLPDAPGPAIAEVLAERRAAVSSAAQQLRTLFEGAALSQTMETLAASFVHLHVNRLGGLDWAPEQQVLGLLLRTRESLDKAPPGPPAPAL
jgi:thiopeptide-type bacteriocin biosynthesis protein